MSSVLGSESKALLMSSVAKSVRCADFGAFMPTCMCCVSVVRSVAVDCFTLKPCWVGERGVSGDVKIGTILPSFQMLGMVFC